MVHAVDVEVVVEACSVQKFKGWWWSQWSLGDARARTDEGVVETAAGLVLGVAALVAGSIGGGSPRPYRKGKIRSARPRIPALASLWAMAFAT